MCEATTILFAASMIVTAASGVYAADSAKKAGKAGAEIARQDAAMDDFRAEQTGRIGAIEEEKHRAKVRLMAGSQRATAAANGIDSSSGTVADMIDDTYQMGEADALTIRFNAMQEAYGLRHSAVNRRNDGTMALWQGKSQAKATYLSTAGSLLGMGAQGAKAGMFSRGATTTTAGRTAGGYGSTMVGRGASMAGYA